MLAFLAKQTSIRRLHPGQYFYSPLDIDVVIPHGILPQLAAISGPDDFIVKNIRNRPVSYIQFEDEAPLSLLSGGTLSTEPVKGVELHYAEVATESEALQSPSFAHLEFLCGLCVYTEEVRGAWTHLGIGSPLICRYFIIGRESVSLYTVKIEEATHNRRLYIL
jgi:hypothetical protein